jgi:hypothetical protein
VLDLPFTIGFEEMSSAEMPCGVGSVELPLCDGRFEEDLGNKHTALTCLWLAGSSNIKTARTLYGTIRCETSCCDESIWVYMSSVRVGWRELVDSLVEYRRFGKRRARRRAKRGEWRLLVRSTGRGEAK